jgi:hypothetical protein
MGIVIAMVGAVGTAIAALADPLGIGEGHVFGWLQLTGVIVGAVVILFGLVMAMEWMPFFGRPAAGEGGGAATTTAPQTTIVTDRSREERPTERPAP